MEHKQFIENFQEYLKKLKIGSKIGDYTYNGITKRKSKFTPIVNNPGPFIGYDFIDDKTPDDKITYVIIPISSFNFKKQVVSKIVIERHWREDNIDQSSMILNYSIQEKNYKYDNVSKVITLKENFIMTVENKVSKKTVKPLMYKNNFNTMDIIFSKNSTDNNNIIIELFGWAKIRYIVKETIRKLTPSERLNALQKLRQVID